MKRRKTEIMPYLVTEKEAELSWRLNEKKLKLLKKKWLLSETLDMASFFFFFSSSFCASKKVLSTDIRVGILP